MPRSPLRAPADVKPPSRRRWVVLLVTTMIIAAAAAVAQTWTSLRNIDYGYKIAKATRQRAQLLETNRKLRIELALLKRPERITRLAAQAGLRAPEPRQVKRLRLPAEGEAAPVKSAAARSGQPHLAATE